MVCTGKERKNYLYMCIKGDLKIESPCQGGEQNAQYMSKGGERQVKFDCKEGELRLDCLGATDRKSWAAMGVYVCPLLMHVTDANDVRGCSQRTRKKTDEHVSITCCKGFSFMCLMQCVMGLTTTQTISAGIHINVATLLLMYLM